MQQIINQLYRYFMTGGIAAIVDAGGFSLLIGVRVETLFAACASFIVAAIVNYQLTSRYVFNVKPSKNQFYKFLLIATLGLLINVSITESLISYLSLMPMFAKVIAIAITFIVNFLLNLLLVFKV